MSRFKTSAALIAIAASASACTHHDAALTPVHNPSLYSVNQPVVQRSNYVFDANVGDRQRLADWFDALQLRYGDRIHVDDQAYADPSTRQMVADLASEYGLLLSPGAPVTGGSAPPPGSVRVVVARTTASVPGCPIWEDELVGAPERTSTNFGCATNSNLAAMIADPNDLVLGQTRENITDTNDTTKAVDLYRKRVPAGWNKLKATNTGGSQ